MNDTFTDIYTFCFSYLRRLSKRFEEERNIIDVEYRVKEKEDEKGKEKEML